MKKKDTRETSIQSGETELLADLALTGEQAEQTKAGAETRTPVADPVFVIIGGPRVGE